MTSEERARSVQNTVDNIRETRNTPTTTKSSSGSPDLSRSFTQSAEGNITYRSPKQNTDFAKALQNTGSAGTHGGMQNRVIGGQTYTLPTDVRSDWRPGEAYYPDIKPTLVGQQRTGQTGDGKNYNYGYQQQYRYIDPKTGHSHAAQESSRQHQERLAQAGGYGDQLGHYIQSGLGRVYTDPKSSNAVTRDPANRDKNLNDLQYGSLGHKQAFMSANPGATQLDYLDYLGIPYRGQSEEALANALSTPYAQRRDEDLTHNREMAAEGDPYGFGNRDALRQITGGVAHYDETGNLIPEGQEIPTEERSALLQQLTGDEQATWGDRPNYGEDYVPGPEDMTLSGALQQEAGIEGETADAQQAAEQPTSREPQPAPEGVTMPETSGGFSGTTVTVIDPEGNTAEGYIGMDNRTYMADGSRPAVDSQVWFEPGKGYKVVPSGTERDDGTTIEGKEGVGGYKLTEDALNSEMGGQPTAEFDKVIDGLIEEENLPDDTTNQELYDYLQSQYPERDYSDMPVDNSFLQGLGGRIDSGYGSYAAASTSQASEEDESVTQGGGASRPIHETVGGTGTPVQGNLYQA